MQIPVFARACEGANAAIRRRAGDVLILGLACAAAAAGFTYLPRFAPPAVPDAPKPAFVQNQDRAEAGESTEEFLERVASAHVASLSAPSSSAIGTTAGQTNELATAPPRPATALRHSVARPTKAPVVVASTAQSSPQAQPPAAAIETAAAPAPTKIDWLAPLHYGMQLAADTGKFVAASNARVIGAIASAGDTLISFGKKPKE